MKRGWHESRDGGTFRLSRRLLVRWDVAAETDLPDLGRRRLAHAVRQDLWRMLQDVKGLQPVVEVTRRDGGCRVRAGGAIAGPPGDLPQRIEGMLEDPAHRAAWVRAARHRGLD